MAVPFTVQQIDHVVLRVRDPRRMRAFYCDVLGCVPEREVPEIGLLQLRAGSSLIDLVDVAGKLGQHGGAAPGPDGHNVDHVCLRVAPFDRDAIQAHLHAHGARLGEFGMRYGAEGMGPSQYVYDPEGNLVELKGPPATPHPRRPDATDDATST
jgi:glyoxylase I family protein